MKPKAAVKKQKKPSVVEIEPVTFEDDVDDWESADSGSDKENGMNGEDSMDISHDFEEGDEFADEFEEQESDDEKKVLISGSEESESETELEKLANATRIQEAEDEIDADEEMQTNIASREVFVLPSGQEIELEAQAPDLTIVQTRIQEIIRALNNFKLLKEDGRSRHEYIDQLTKDICSYYGYNTYLAEKLLALIPLFSCIISYVKFNWLDLS